MNKIKASAGVGAMVKLALAGGALWFGPTKTLYNVEGGHRAIVFNRFEGIKDKVYPERTRRRDQEATLASPVEAVTAPPQLHRPSPTTESSRRDRNIGLGTEAYVELSRTFKRVRTGKVPL